MNVVRRALAAAAISGTALAGVATVGATAAQAATKVPTHLAVKAPHAITYGNTVTVWGRLTYAHRRRKLPAGQTVTLLERATPRAKWHADGTGTTNANGVVTITSTKSLTRTEQFRLRYAGDSSIKPNTRASQSAVKTVKVRYSVTAAATSAGAPWTIGGVVRPANNRAMVLLQRHEGKRWVTVGHAREKLTNGQGLVYFTVTGAKNAGRSYRLVKPAAHGLLTGMSNSVTLS